jgi:hypothetical protein
MQGMGRLSLKTMLAYVAVLAVVCAICMNRPVVDLQTTHIQGNLKRFKTELDIRSIEYLGNNTLEIEAAIKRPPTTGELALRLAWAWPLAIVGMLVAPWIIRRIKPPFTRG